MRSRHCDGVSVSSLFVHVLEAPAATGFCSRPLTKPLERTRPKGDPDPGWREISWDDALARISSPVEVRQLDWDLADIARG